MGLRVNEVNASDEICIRTHFSDYRFRVIHPCQCKGLLSGGPLGQQEHEAFFAGTLLPANIDAGGLTLLETGRRAVFLIGGNGLQKLTTSIITEITLAETQGDECETLSDIRVRKALSLTSAAIR
jgi:hypothetical protein